MQSVFNFNVLIDNYQDHYLGLLENLEDIETKTRRPRVFQMRRNYYEEYDEESFKTRFRLSKPSALNVLQLIENKLEFPNDKNNSLAPINQLLLTLRYYATGCHQLTMGDFSGVSRPTANRVIHRVTAAIASLSRDYIKFPHTDTDIRKTQLEFYNIARFPKVVGALDCTHIKIISPGGSHAETFRNRKGYMSINVQAICNAQLLLTDLVVRWPGSTHDERIFSASRRHAMFELGMYGDSVLVADSGYMNRNYLMMPLDRVSTSAESLYNESQIRTRNPVERLFGIWKRRFPVLALGIRVNLKNAPPIIVATGVLHNILQMRGDQMPLDDLSLDLPAPWEEILHQGRIQRSIDNNVRDLNPSRRSLITNYYQSLV
ncbi:putative nuclease HARBI1 [Melitaea cinxia]|uniref:putative nuclease HARBI1 n=1 Tax=Melitaea cinxia TaxID=113334 RepID=UPI001E271503|nr:putative nuclease HARBI1 [Melitaea cinxia]XP_045449096.1 putative nuclease HARBI1 [Melitaea cinxia]